MSELVGNPEGLFSHVVAQLMLSWMCKFFFKVHERTVIKAQ